MFCTVFNSNWNWEIDGTDGLPALSYKHRWTEIYQDFLFVECRPGYFGIGCDSPCPKGLFGERCAGKCLPRCSKDECDRIYGCPYVTNDQKMTTTVEGIEKIFVNLS